VLGDHSCRAFEHSPTDRHRRRAACPQ
jgi:hypothetical protein